MKVLVAGVGMTRFQKPRPGGDDYPEFAQLAIRRALADANIDYSDIGQVFAGYVYGDSTCGQRAVYGVGLTGVPIVNVNNNCSTGSSALYLGRQCILSGQADCVLVVGFEKMASGSLGSNFSDRTNPLDSHIDAMSRSFDVVPNVPFAPQLFGNAGKQHMIQFGTTREQIAKIAVKNHSHSVNNPYAQFREEYSLEQVLNSPKVHEPLTKLQCCPTSNGAGAAVLVSEAFAMSHGLLDDCVEIVAQTMATDGPTSLGPKANPINVVGFEMTAKAATQAYKMAGISPEQIAVAEVHDCFSTNELITYEALEFSPLGKAGMYIDNNKFTYGGNVVVNPSGGLISKGHPLGATGLAQCAELVWQLRGHAQKRQVKNATYALQHNLGLGGACVITIYKKLTNRPALGTLNSDPSILEKWENSGRDPAIRPFAWDSTCRTKSKL